MKKYRFTEQQIVSILKEVELGAKVGATCRKYGISDATYCKWKTACAGMRFRSCAAENARLKKMYADLALVHHALWDVVSRKL